MVVEFMEKERERERNESCSYVVLAEESLRSKHCRYGIVAMRNTIAIGLRETQ